MFWFCFWSCCFHPSPSPDEDGLTAYRHQDFQTALRLWQPLAEQGNAEAQEGIGGIYERGDLGKPDWTEAVKWYQKAADQGLEEAQLDLAWMYKNGHGVKKDSVEAFRLFRKSAELGM